jgi:ABC-type glycerol-3-phosphate transport system substrate-binding protein
MLFNRDWLKTLNLDEAPASWEQFSAVCNKAADRVKGTVCFGLNPNNYVFEQWIAAFGGQVTTDDMNVLQVSTPMAITAMNRLAEFIRTNQAYRVATLVQSREDFASARTLFTFDWSDGLLDVGTTIKQRADFDWGLALLPGAGQKVSTKYSAPLWVITRVPGRLDSSREKASWLFIRWLTQTVQTAHWASLTNELPARLSAINALGSRQPLSANQLTLLRDIVPLARPDPLVSGWRCLEATLSAGITQIMDGQPVTTTLQMTQALGQPQLTQDCVD